MTDTDPHDAPSNSIQRSPDSDDNVGENRERPSTWHQMKTSEDWWAIWCAGAILVFALGAVLFMVPAGFSTRMLRGDVIDLQSPLKSVLAKPGKWSQNPMDAFVAPASSVPASSVPASSVPASSGGQANHLYVGVLGAFVVIAGLFTLAMRCRGENAFGFFKAFPFVFLLATIAYVLASQTVIKSYNLEYALWALMVGMIISNTIGTPNWVRPAVQTEFYIKTGLVLMGAGVLVSRLMALGLGGVGVAWVVTPIVLISTYLFGQRVLKLPSKSLNMVISADMSVCGVSAAVATAASCRAKKEELSLAIGLSLSFTVVMMVVLPLLIKALGLPSAVGGAWLGGTIDATGAVAVAGATLGGQAEDVALTVKMIQNILIGVTSFLVAIYWVTYVDASDDGVRPGIGEIWYRFPKFVLGFITVSIVFSLIHSQIAGGNLIVDAMVKGSTKTIRGWLFCLAFVSIGLETNFKQLLPYFRGGKPAVLYVCGQSLNLVLTLVMAYVMFEIVFPQAAP